MASPGYMSANPMVPACTWRPVFVVGSARSGTTLIYHTLLSTGEYAVYRGEPAVFDLLAARFGKLDSRAARERLMRVWPRSHLARASGYEDPAQCSTLVEECRSTGDFLRRVMSAMAERQGVDKWAVWGPDNLLLMPWIKREMPDARFIHMIRDGRDIALSMHTKGFIRPFPWDRAHQLVVSALHWQWKLLRGRRDGRRLGADYLELRFEALVSQPQEALAAVSRFLGHSFDYQQILRSSVGTLRDSNSTFKNDGSNPVERWRQRLTPAQLAQVEQVIGGTLDGLGYPLAAQAQASPPVRLRWLYPAFFEVKHLLRTHTPLGRMVDDRRMRLDEPTMTSVPGQQPAPARASSESA